MSSLIRTKYQEKFKRAQFILILSLYILSAVLFKHARSFAQLRAAFELKPVSKLKTKHYFGVEIIDCQFPLQTSFGL